MWYVHTMEYCPALKRNAILIHATTWMNFEHIMLRYISQTEKDQVVCDSVYLSIKNGQIHGDGKQNRGHQRLEGQQNEWGVPVSVGPEFQFGMMKKFGRWDNGDGCKQCEYT